MSAVDKALENPIQLGIAIAGVLAVAYFLTRKAVGEVADTAGGIVSGNNALTRGTAYEGAGVLGTLGAATNSALGGVPQSIGEAIGGWLYDATHADYDPKTGLQTASKKLQTGASNTDLLWGPLGSIELRTSKR